MVVIKGRRPANLEMDDIDDGNNSDDGAPSTIYMSDLSSQANSSLNASQHRQKMAQQKVCPALARLTLFHGTKLKGWDDSVMNPTHYMHSFSETKIKSLCRRTDRQKWVIYNQSHMSRSYPSGSRVDSSNYSPILPWALGTQLVALNFQTVDAPLLLNDGRFRENGGCGYVLKSTRLIDIQEPINEFNEENRVPVKLSVRVLSGSCLPKPNDARTGDCINPYVKVSVYDIRNGDKEISTTFSTGVVIANGFFPIWNGEKFTLIIENYETAMLQMTVYDKGSTIANATYTSGGDEFVASASIPISCLRKGLRSVKLFDTSNTRSGAFNFSSLLIDIKKEKAERIESTMAEI
jgi:phosphatidylinositol phospholipase C delta